MPLLAVPNVSEGRRGRTIDAIGEAFQTAQGVRVLDVHSDVDHNRSVFTLAGDPAQLRASLLAGITLATQMIDVGDGRDPARVGQHPHVGAVDVVPVVYLSPEQGGSACAQALVIAAEIGERLEIPVFIYGDLAEGRQRAELRRGGVSGLRRRIESGELRPDFGPGGMHPSAGATLVAAREPLVAFNVELSPPATLADAKRIASLIREGGPEGLTGVRAIGVQLSSGVAQVSMNVERPLEIPLAQVVEAVVRHAPVTRAELVGLTPRVALDGFPEDLPMPGFDPASHVIENALGF